MATEALLINPRRRRRSRRKKAKSTHRRKRARARRNPFALSRRPRRRRRARSTRSHARRRRAHRNPRLPLIGSVNLQAIGAGFAGYLGTRYGATWAQSFVPATMTADPNTKTLVRIGIKAAIGFVALPMLARMLRVRGASSALAIGAGIAVVQDLVDSFLPNLLPMPAGVTSIADYETQTISAYETAQLSGSADAYGGGAYGGGSYVI